MYNTVRRHLFSAESNFPNETLVKTGWYMASQDTRTPQHRRHHNIPAPSVFLAALFLDRMVQHLPETHASSPCLFLLPATFVTISLAQPSSP